MPKTVKLHPVFHLSLLEPAVKNPLQEQIKPPPPPVIVYDEPEYEIEEILDSKVIRTRPKYYVKWTGHSQPTWEPAEYHKYSASVDEYHKKYPERPGPWTNLERTGARLLEGGGTFTY